MIHAVRAALLTAEWVPRVIPPPHDSLTPAARAEHLASHPDSFLHVVRSAGMGHGHPTEHRGLAAEGDAALQSLLARGAYTPRQESRLYVQRIIATEGEQFAILGAIRDGERKLLTHEDVHSGRVRALAAHFGVVGAMSSPVVVTSRPNVSDRSVIDRSVTRPPLLDAEASDGTRLTLWGVDRSEFDVLGDLYVVDGHHRVAAATQARFDQLFVAYVPPEDLRIDSFDRIVDELSLMPRKVIEILSPWCDVADEPGPAVAPAPGSILLQLDGHRLLAHRHEPDGFDTKFVHDVILPEVFGITQVSDPRLTYRPSLAGHGNEPVVITTAPVDLEQVLDVADAGAHMPPKTTYFVPKARSGLVLVPC